jgi:prophage regulatory protein
MRTRVCGGVRGLLARAPGRSHQAAGNSGRRWMIARSETIDRIRHPLEHLGAPSQEQTQMRFLSKRQVRELTTLSFTQIDRLEAAGKFPKRMRLGNYPNSRVVWLEEEILEWMRERVAKREPLRLAS